VRSWADNPVAKPLWHDEYHAVSEHGIVHGQLGPASPVGTFYRMSYLTTVVGRATAPQTCCHSDDMVGELRGVQIWLSGAVEITKGFRDRLSQAISPHRTRGEDCVPTQHDQVLAVNLCCARRRVCWSVSDEIIQYTYNEYRSRVWPSRASET